MATSSEETIVAQATAFGEAAIAVVRLSGPRVQALLQGVFDKANFPPRRSLRGTYRLLGGQILDDTLVTFFRGPRSYTGEDVAEISCHGNPLLVHQMIEDLVGRGCRLAEPGEFTRRAFLNGKMDLSQAEAVIDLIRARSEKAVSVAQRQLQGALGNRISPLIAELLTAIAAVEAYIDFPEEDLPPEEENEYFRRIEKIRAELVRIGQTARYGALLREGVRTIILGAPNAGKSSLLNRLVGHERVLVSEIAGTTRDAVEEVIHLGAHCIRIVDTAGIRVSSDRLESLSIERSLAEAARADLILLILDASLPHPAFPELVRSRLQEANTIVVLNKCDLVGGAPDAGAWKDFAVAPVSALTGEGIERLRTLIEAKIESLNPASDAETVAISARHSLAIGRAIEALSVARGLLRDSEAAELVAHHLREALAALGEITGAVDNERVLDELFATFCIGK
jgi:tRNA modification GTPase